MLQPGVCRLTVEVAVTSMSSLTRELPGLIHNFQSLLKEGEPAARVDVARVCTVLTTAEYCLETTQQLEAKLKEKVRPQLADKIDLGAEQDLFGQVIGQCIQLLVADLESACEPALITMAKVLHNLSRYC